MDLSDGDDSVFYDMDGTPGPFTASGDRDRTIKLTKIEWQGSDTCPLLGSSVDKPATRASDDPPAKLEKGGKRRHSFQHRNYSMQPEARVQTHLGRMSLTEESLFGLTADENASGEQKKTSQSAHEEESTMSGSLRRSNSMDYMQVSVGVVKQFSFCCAACVSVIQFAF